MKQPAEIHLPVVLLCQVALVSGFFAKIYVRCVATSTPSYGGLSMTSSILNPASSTIVTKNSLIKSSDFYQADHG